MDNFSTEYLVWSRRAYAGVGVRSRSRRARYIGVYADSDSLHILITFD